MQSSIRQLEMQKGNILNLFFQDIVFSVQFDALDPRTQEQFLAENCQTWCLNPDFPLKMQPTLGISKTKAKLGRRGDKKPVRQSGFQGATPDGHKFVLLFFQHLMTILWGRKDS